MTFSSSSSPPLTRFQGDVVHPDYVDSVRRAKTPAVSVRVPQARACALLSVVSVLCLVLWDHVVVPIVVSALLLLVFALFSPTRPRSGVVFVAALGAWRHARWLEDAMVLSPGMALNKSGAAVIYLFAGMCCTTPAARRGLVWHGIASALVCAMLAAVTWPTFDAPMSAAWAVGGFFAPFCDLAARGAQKSLDVLLVGMVWGFIIFLSLWATTRITMGPLEMNADDI